MNALFTWLAQPLVHRVGWTLLHFLWQGAGVAALFALAQAGLSRKSPGSRYLAGCLAMILMIVAPVMTFCWWSQPKVIFPPHVALQPSVPFVPATVAPSLSLSAPAETPAPFSPSPNQPEASMLPSCDVALRFAVLFWLAGVLALSLRMGLGVLRVARLKRSKTEPVDDLWQQRLARLQTTLQISRPVRLVKSALVEVPTVLGWLRPIILLPASCLTGLTTTQLESILAHELAHVRRHDYLVNLLQNTVETLLFYHPAVWWISSRVRAEREHCCDEIAVRVCGDRVLYSKALASLEQARFRRASLVLAADGGSLLERIRHLAGVPRPDMNSRRQAGAAILGLVVVLVFVAGAQSQSVVARVSPDGGPFVAVDFTITITNLPRANRVEGERIQVVSGHCVVGRETWSMDLAAALNATGHWYCDGGNVFENYTLKGDDARSEWLAKRYGLANLAAQRSPTAPIQLVVSPGRHVLGDLVANLSWTAFCSGPFLREAGRIVPNPVSLITVTPTSFAYQDKTEVFPDTLGLTQNMELYTDRRRLASSFADSRIRVRSDRDGARPDFDSIDFQDHQMAFRYNTLATTNVNGCSIPLSFSIMAFSDTGWPDHRFHPRLRASGVTTSVRAVNVGPKPILREGGSFEVIDHRFGSSVRLLDCIDYRLTNSSLPAVSDPALQALYKEALASASTDPQRRPPRN